MLKNFVFELYGGCSEVFKECADLLPPTKIGT